LTKQLVLTDFLDRAVHLYGDKPAIISQDGTHYTYKQVNERVQQLSHGLASIGIEKGDHVAYLAPNTLEMYEGFYGLFQVGAIMVSLNTRLTPEDYLYILNHSESKALFVDVDLYHLVEPIISQLKTVHTIIVHDGVEDGNSIIPYEPWLKEQSPSPFPRAELNENDLSTLLYTSGTTGKPKGVMLSHRNNYLHALSAQHHLRVSDKDVLIHILPMFHVNGWGSPFYYTANGSTQIMQKKIDPSDIIERIKKHGVTAMHMAPTVLSSLINQYQKNQETFKQNLRVMVAGAAPPKAFIKELEEKVGWEFLQVYGMTETSPLITTSYMSSEDKGLAGEDYYRAKAKAGYEMIRTNIRVVNELGKDVTANGSDVGEIIVKGHGVMQGYWKNEEETKHTITDGWLYTGDMGTIDSDGRIAIVDRKKDIIISGGENISSIEVEDVLYEHPAIDEVALVAVPHEKWGETPHAIVVLKEGHLLTEKELIDFTREKLAHFKCPTSVTFLDELPKTASGKIQKVVLREMI